MIFLPWFSRQGSAPDRQLRPALTTVRVSGPFNQRGGVQTPTVARTSHKPRNARLADLISEADQTYEP